MFSSITTRFMISCGTLDHAISIKRTLVQQTEANNINTQSSNKKSTKHMVDILIIFMDFSCLETQVTEHVVVHLKFGHLSPIVPRMRCDLEEHFNKFSSWICAPRILIKEKSSTRRQSIVKLSTPFSLPTIRRKVSESG